MDSEEIKEVGAQMGNPRGPLGTKVACTMNKTNIGMTLNSINNLNLQDSDRVLELGHGNCGHLKELLSKAKDLSFCGLEISELMASEAIAINREHLHEKISFTIYDGVNIPFPDHTFDKIFTINTLYFWEKPEEMLEEIYRVLKPGGRFCLTFAEKSFMEKLPFTKYNFHLYTLAEAESLVRKTKFELSEIDRRNESYDGKNGEKVYRDFVTMVLEKHE